MPRFLIAYDIRSTRTRTKIAARLEKAGGRIQKSVFLPNLSEADFATLEQDLLEMLEEDDSLLFMPCCERCYAKTNITGGEIPKLLVV